MYAIRSYYDYVGAHVTMLVIPSSDRHDCVYPTRYTLARAASLCVSIWYARCVLPAKV